MTITEFINRFEGKGLDGGDLVEELWKTGLSVREKIILTLDLNDLEPSYSVLMNMWLEYSLSSNVTKEYNDIIYSYYQSELSDKTKDLEMTTEYSLYFDILEDPDRNEDAWQFFLCNNPSDSFIRILLANSGPVPYELKQKLYDELLEKEDFHRDIYISIRHSCFDNCGNVNKEKALETLNKLNLKGLIEELDSQKGFRKYQDVVAFLNNEIGKFVEEKR